MKPFDPDKYKNIGKSSQILVDENKLYTLIDINNYTSEKQHYRLETERNYIQLFFNLKKTSKVAFNMEHCAVSLQKNESSMVYFKDDKMNILFEMDEETQIIVMLISVHYFHSLFSDDNNYLSNFNNFAIGKPIIETKTTTPSQQVVLHQIINKNDTSPLGNLFLKAKFFELFSLYFSNNEGSDSEYCPFMANEDTLSQLKKVKDIIIENMANPPSLEELSKNVGLNIKKLKQGFKEVYGSPVFSFLLNYKLEFSKKLLIENQLNVNEIGIKVGYSNSSHFIAAFKRKFGVTPKQFTKQTNT
ncbi:MAG: helix-turn-helix domain-containing protein [Wenyingzhuangia sp.]|jgi:AraC family transcriptional regulator, transcriptional activator of the genes for pyochelin and ferripyochelin receptors|uniref:helix-turn-helix domain-containing protein n=1 Tax=Wenyingzhuangia sp. TaxID=1964193 RepID=UPI00321BE8D2